MSEEKKPDVIAGPQAAGGEGAEQSQQPRLSVDDSTATTRYANFFLVSAGPEEIMMLFGLRSGDGTRAKIEDRIAVSPSNAKRILLALSQTLKRYEDTFGTIDLTPKVPAQPPQAQADDQTST